VPVRLPKAVIADIDRWAKRKKVDKRSKAVRALIEKGLADALDE
jgi:metal-responsive CopG/Arc/MetJ family transcriptional regulator